MKTKKLLLLFSLLFTYNLFSQVVNCSVDFTSSTGKIISSNAFGLNVFKGFNPNLAGNPGNSSYKNAVSEMNPGMIRYHSWEMLSASTNATSWLNANEDWDAVKINNALTNAYTFNPERVMNIPSWPNKWNISTTDRRLNPTRYQDFANWCASLVQIININQNRGIIYWEVTNERDDVYGGNMATLGTIYNLAVASMKAIDPNIKTGGPAFANPYNNANIQDFFNVSHPNVDFVTYHTYCNGDVNATNASVYNFASQQGYVTSNIKSKWALYSTRNIKFYHNEFNISHNPPDGKMINQVGQIYDALALMDICKAGADGAMAWNECDDWYGKISNSFSLRPSAYLHKNLNARLRNDAIYNTTSSDNSKVVLMGSKSNSYYHFEVINRADADVYAKFSFTGLPSWVNSSTNFTCYENQANGGIIQKTYTFAELTGASGILLANGVISILEFAKKPTYDQ